MLTWAHSVKRLDLHHQAFKICQPANSLVAIRGSNKGANTPPLLARLGYICRIFVNIRR